MSAIVIDQLATEELFDEDGYRLANPDVASAIAAGAFESAFSHFLIFGKNEKRLQRNTKNLAVAKRAKRERIRPLLCSDMRLVENAVCFDFLTKELRETSGVVSTDNVSSNNYPPECLELIEKHKDGLILDCGAGRRPIYYHNVVNFEIVDYDTTDVRGVGEELPFEDNSFDAVFSLAVLEHVKDPFQCAKEIIRVLKPGGDLVCVVPFLQPVHGYPGHYYNMTGQGLRNLFEPHISIHRHEVPAYSLPIWTLTWFINSWAAGLHGDTLNKFLDMKLSDLMAPSETYLGEPFVRELSEEKNFELACGTTIFGVKKAP